MSFGTRLKARREQLGITQPQLAELLGVSKGAIGNYETDANSPKATILFKVFDVLKCDANYLFQDEMNELTAEDSVTPDEMDNLVKKYRALDDHGKKMVDFTLQEEYERSHKIRLEQLEEAKKHAKRLDERIPKLLESINTANPPQRLEDIVAEDWGPETDEWVYQLEQFRNNNVAYINSYTDLETKQRAQAIIDEERRQLKAAHNDYESAPGELEKMQEDIAGLKRPE